MSQVVIQSELDAFKANLPSHENVLAEWFMRSLRKGRLISSHHLGGTYLLICTEVSLYMIKLNQKRIHSHKRYSLLDFTNIQVGYLSKAAEDALDECEINPGLYAIRLHFGPKEFKTFKYPSTDVPDDTQKAFIQVIHSSLKASRRELYHSTHQNLPPAPLPIPSKKQPSPSNTPFPSPPPSPSPKQDTFMVTLPGFCLSTTDEHDPIEGIITITQRHYVFEPNTMNVLDDISLNESITIPLFKIVECAVQTNEDITAAAREFALKYKARILQLFADGKKRIFAVPALQAENARTRLAHWIQAAQDRIAQEVISKSQIEHPLLSRADSTTSFKGDSDILSAKDVLYLQYKMPDRFSMDRWEMVYSTTRSGTSINTFYTKVAQRAPTVIIVEDSNHHIFGGFASEPWVKSKQVHYGSGESFLFKIKPVSKVFKWSKFNDYFMFSSKDFISLGGGGNGYGLWLDSDFEHGSSATCDTFLNEPLSTNEQFRVLRMEVWSLPVQDQPKKTPRPL